MPNQKNIEVTQANIGVGMFLRLHSASLCFCSHPGRENWRASHYFMDNILHYPL